MRHLISAMHSLACLEYQHEVEEQGKLITYDEFKHETFRTPQARSENDRFFAVRRGTVSLLQFRRNVLPTLKVVAPYHVDDPELMGYWRAGAEQMLQIIDERIRALGAPIDCQSLETVLEHGLHGNHWDCDNQSYSSRSGEANVRRISGPGAAYQLAA